MEAQGEVVAQAAQANEPAITGPVFEWLFLFWTASIPVMLWAHVRFQHYTIPLSDFVFPLVLTAFFTALITGGLHWQKNSWFVPLAAYACALILSTLFSQNFRQSVPKAAGDIYLVAAAALTVQYVRDQKSLRRILLAWLTGVAVTTAGAAAGVILFFLGRVRIKQNPFLSRFGTLPPGHYPRIKATFLDPNMMCSYMACGILLMIAARHAGFISKKVFRVLFPLSLGAAVFSISPGLGGLCVALGWWLASRDCSATRRRIIGGFGMVIALLVLAGAPISMTPLMRTSVVQAILHPEPSGRLKTWDGAWHTFRIYPLFGQGLESKVADVKFVVASGEHQTLTDAHNTWLSIMAQQGIVGLLAFGWVVFHLLRRFRFASLCSDDWTVLKFAIGLAMTGGFLYSSLSGSFENTRHVWAVMGLLAAVQEPGASGVELIKAG